MMSYSLLCRTGRYGLLVVGLLGLFTSMQLACTFSDDPPEATKKKNPVTDSGPISGEDGGGTSSGGTYTGYGYGYGYNSAGCYGYGYGYTPTYEGTGTGICE